MRVLGFLIVLALLLILLGLIAAWGVATSTTGLVLAAGHLADQAMIQLLTCAFIATLLIGLPGLVYTAFRIGKLAALRRHATSPANAPALIVSLQEPRAPANALPTQSPIAPLDLMPRRRVRRTSRSVYQATSIARRWFQ